MNAGRRARIMFFAEHAGHATPPGRLICARDLADAEEWRDRMESDGRLSVSWEFDEDPDLSWADDFVSGEIRLQHLEVLSCQVAFDDDEVSLGNIVVHFGDPYCRVVEAELSAELMGRVAS